jgi:hypothetical protein
LHSGVRVGHAGRHVVGHHVAHQHFAHRRVRFGRGLGCFDDGFGYDDCYSPWATQWYPYCSYDY